MRKSRFLLIAAALLSFDISLFQTALAFSPAWSTAFGAGETLVSNPPLLLGAGLALGAVFATFGAYALSGAGLIRRLPLVRLGLLVIGLAYLVRGVPFVPQLLVVLDATSASAVVRLQDVMASFVSLLAGVAYLAGLALALRNLSTEATAQDFGTSRFARLHCPGGMSAHTKGGHA